MPQIDITAIVLGLISLGTSITLGVFQYKKWKDEARDAEAKAQANLVTVALNINKQEMDTLRTVNEALRQEIQEKNKRLAELEGRSRDGK